MYQVGDIVKDDGTTAVITKILNDSIAGFTAYGGLMYYGTTEEAEAHIEPTGWRIDNMPALLENLRDGNYDKAAAYNQAIALEAEKAGIEKIVVIDQEEYRALLRQERTLEFYKGYVDGLETALKLTRREGANVDE